MDARNAERREGVALVASKITTSHLERLAIVYVRQSTYMQTVKHPESTRVQYSLTDHVVTLGWPRERVLVIDDDLGRTATTTEGRLGFHRMVAEVGLGHVGILFGFQMSRLARSCSDWHRLLEVCALFGTLLGDFDGIYEPANFNDRLLLGFKGEISAAEIHFNKQRMHTAKLAKVERGELGVRLARGYFKRPSGQIIKDPDEHAQHVVDLVFDQFRKCGTVQGLLRYLVKHDLKLPLRVAAGPDKGELTWTRPSRSSILSMLKNPAYAGTYAYGRRAVDPRAKKPGRPATGRKAVDMNQWAACLHDRLPAYISWEQYEQNQRQLELNRNTTRGVARRGSALLTGLVRCGRCGHRMTTHYSDDAPRYQCTLEAQLHAGAWCQSLTTGPIDLVVEALLLRALEPSALEVSLAVAADVDRERAREEHLWQERLERAHYEVERARRQYDAVEPENRLVARTLEHTLEERLASEQKLQEDHRRARATRPASLTEPERAAIRALSMELPKLWNSPTTTPDQRKEVARQLVEEVRVKVVGESEQVELVVRWAGGHETATTTTRPVVMASKLSYYEELLGRAEQLRREGHTLEQVADTLNAEGWCAGRRRETFNAPMVTTLLKSKKATRGTPTPNPPPEKLEADEWTLPALAHRLSIPRATLIDWAQRGRIQARKMPSAHPAGVWIIRADEQELVRLAKLRTEPLWPRKPSK